LNSSWPLSSSAAGPEGAPARGLLSEDVSLALRVTNAMVLFLLLAGGAQEQLTGEEKHSGSSPVCSAALKQWTFVLLKLIACRLLCSVLGA
jgi:hypothetical protein